MTTLPDFVIEVPSTKIAITETESPVSVVVSPITGSAPTIDVTVPGKVIAELGPALVSDTVVSEIDRTKITVDVETSPVATVTVEVSGNVMVEVGIPLIVVGGGGGETTPGTAIRYIGSEEPDTTDWNVNDLWLDTSTEL